MTDQVPRPSESTRFLIIGAGFAGASTAWALARLGEGPGLVLEREATYGVHASGRNAGLLKVSEDDALLRALAVRTAARLKPIEAVETDLIQWTGGLTLFPAELAAVPDELQDGLKRNGVPAERLAAAQVCARFPFLRRVSFEAALWCGAEGIVDVHALLTHYLRAARAAGFALRTDWGVEDLVIEAGRVVGVETAAGVIRADVVIDATGAWAGRLGRAGRPLPLQPMRRHLFVSGPIEESTRALPFVWFEGADFYFRGEGDGLLLSPCDETPAEPGSPSTDPAAAEMLADKLDRHAPGLGELSLRKGWACLRTFAPDRRPLIGADPDLPGLFHVSGLGGFGVMTSAAVGELAAESLMGRAPDWIDVAPVDPTRGWP
jgi:glycine/D-amino acid oxidase-like deaminating enzyme